MGHSIRDDRVHTLNDNMRAIGGTAGQAIKAIDMHG